MGRATGSAQSPPMAVLSLRANSPQFAPCGQSSYQCIRHIKSPGLPDTSLKDTFFMNGFALMWTGKMEFSPTPTKTTFLTK